MRALVRSLWLPALALSLLAGTAHAHNRSQGASFFTLDDQGHIDVTVEMSARDLPELCSVDLHVSDERMAAMEDHLTTCLERGLRMWLTLKGDGVECPVSYARWHKRAPDDVIIEGSAACARTPTSLELNWGLFAGTGLDHVSVARVKLPSGVERLGMFSRRAPRMTVDVASPWRTVFILGSSAALALLVGVGLVLRRRRVRRERESEA